MFSHAQYEALRTAAGLLDRRARGRLILTGADRRAYLQGLLTNDIAALDARHGCYAALLTPQGRMISDMRVSELGDRVLIDLPGSTAETVRQRLADFIFAEDVDVKDAHASWSQLGLYGPKAAELIAAVLAAPQEGADAPARERLEAMPVNANAAGSFGASAVVVVRSDDYGALGFELFAESGRADDLALALVGAGAQPISRESADVVRIESGRPEFGIDMDEHTIPLEAGIEDRAISLTKGCYVGQEIIIRVLHRGHGRVARHLVGLIGDPGSAIRRGERLRAGGREVGAVTSGAVSPRLGRPVGLAYAHRDYAEPGRVLQLEDDVRRVTVSALPLVPPGAR